MPSNNLKKAIARRQNPEGYLSELIDELETKLEEAQGVIDDAKTKDVQRQKEFSDAMAKLTAMGSKLDENKILTALMAKIPNLESLRMYIMERIQMPKDGKDGADGMDAAPFDYDRVVAAVTDDVMKNLAEQKIIDDAMKPEEVEETSEDIAGKLNGKKGILDISTIASLDGILKNIRRAIAERGGGGGKGGGGGMGNTIVQSFDISSATTTITLSNRVAANGNAMWLYYEGAFIQKGNAFTVGADRKTVTLLFTPEDGTHIDAVFIRG